jgi:hypothetical protein
VRAGGRPRGVQQGGFGQPGDLRGHGHVCDHRTFLRASRGRPRGGGPGDNGQLGSLSATTRRTEHARDRQGDT